MADEIKKHRDFAADENSSVDFTDDYYVDFDSDFLYPNFSPDEDFRIIIPTEEDQISPSTNNDNPAASSFQEKKQNIFLTVSEFLAGAVVSFPSVIEKTGETTINLFAALFKKYGAILAVPFVMFGKAIKKAFLSAKAAIKAAPNNFSDDVKQIKYEIKIIRQQLKASGHKAGILPFSVTRKYLVISFSRHDMFWKTVVNTAFPVLMLALSLSFFSNVSKTIFALDVVYNGEHIGYVESEDSFESAKAQAVELVDKNLSDSQKAYLDNPPVYALSRISPNKLSNQNEIEQNMIGASGLKLEMACGIYIDGKFLCAVKNESDAVAVFNSILQPVKDKAKSGTIVDFVEEISYVQGLYPANETVIWDYNKLQNTLNSPKSKAVYHKTKKGETPKSIAKKYSLTLSQLKAYNPGVDLSDLAAGTRLLVSAQTDYVRVKEMKTAVKTQVIPFETVKRESSLMLKGTTKVVQNGSPGKKEITELVTYINGKMTYSTVVSEKQVKAPVNKIIQIGTKSIFSSPYGSSYGGSYGSGYSSGSYGGFIWPTRGAYSLSSRFGYRSASISGWSFHGGVDIVRSGGGSTGTPVIAAASGTVVVAYAGYSGYGNTVVIDHGGGLRTRYAHMQSGSIAVRTGQRVYKGQQIGRIGSTGNVTGPHLHFEVLRNGSKVNPLNYIG